MEPTPFPLRAEKRIQLLEEKIRGSPEEQGHDIVTLASFADTAIRKCLPRGFSTTQMKELLSQWSTKTYKYDKNTKIAVVFTNGNDYIDYYGNRYKNENGILQTLARFHMFDDFTYENKKLKIKLDDCDYLHNLSKNFENPATTFLDWKGITDIQKIEILTKIKAFYHLFSVLDDFVTENRTKWGLPALQRPDFSLCFAVIGNNLRVIFRNLLSCDLDFENYIQTHKSIQTILDTFNRDYSNQSVLYQGSRRITRVLNKNPTRDEWEENKKKDEKRIQFADAGKSFVNTCYAIAADIVAYINHSLEHQEKILKDYVLQLCHLKYIAYWVAVKYRNEQEALVGYKTDENRLKEEFCRSTIALMDSEKSVEHKFSNQFTQIYHFVAHYMPIRETLLNYLRNHATRTSASLMKDFEHAKDFPILDDTNIGECAKYYLIHLPDYLFRQGDEKVVKTPSKDEKRWNEKVTKYSIKGIKYRFVDQPVEELKIKTMHETTRRSDFNLKYY